MSDEHQFTPAGDRAISIVLPQDWEQVPIDPSEHAAWLEARLDIAELGDDVARHLLAAFRSVLVEARGEGLALAGAYLDVLGSSELEDASNGEEPHVANLVAASLSVLVRPAGQLAGALSPFAWEAALRESAAQGALKLVRDPELAKVGPYDAVKAVVLDELPADDDLPAVTQLAVDYYCSIDGGQTILIVGFRTPCTWLQEEFEPLFDVIAETLRIEEPEPVSG